MTTNIDGICKECSTVFLKRAANHVFCSYGCRTVASKRKFNNEWHRDWKRKNTDRYRKHTLVASAKRRAVRDGLPFDITIDDLEIPENCPVLGIPLVHHTGLGGFNDNSPSIDKFIPELGYVKGNVKVISWRANKIKSNATVAEFEKILRYMQGEPCVPSPHPDLN